ncbi:MAG: glycosyltransferase family 2 protein [Bacteroidetes bacterium]|nr:glycosyltransferase family 2 protein [Bacteroidota bacterium]
MIQLSVVIITFNEEKNINRCLDSVKDISDDIIVVDSFSTDRTEEICKSKGARFVQHKFEGYIEQKNWAITQAKFPYVLSLDADEALSDELKKSILEAKQNWKYDGYYTNRLTNYCGQWIHHCGWYPDKKLRLFDLRRGKWGGVNPHDKYELIDGDKSVGMLKGDILHYSYYSVEEHYRQAEKFADISANELKKQGMKILFPMIYLKSAFKFFRNYILNLGFLDGRYGYIICRLTAWETYLKYSKLYSLNNK